MKSFQYTKVGSLTVMLICSSLISTACTSNSEIQKVEASDLKITKTICSEPRPQICTKEYNPVCATIKDASKKTYATGCTACSDKLVVYYSEGACE